MSFFGELKRRNVVRVGVAYTIIGWVGAQIAEFAFENFGAPEWVLKTFVVVVLIGLPFALFFAWAYELTPEGLKREEDVDRSESITPVTGRKIDFLIIGAMAIAIAYFIWERQTPDEAVTPVAQIDDSGSVSEGEASETEMSAPSRSIAVLPFVNMSSDEEQEYFADGLTEEILNSLAKIPDLMVSARTSSFSYKGSVKKIPTIAEELGVGHVLEGSVRRGGTTVRITVQLIRAADGFHLWSETFDRTLDDIIAVQEEIAVHVAATLETTMNPEALKEMMRVGTDSVTAYVAYLTGRGKVAAAGETGDKYLMLDAKEAYESAVALDPKFAAAHWELGTFWWRQNQSNQMFGDITDLPKEVVVANQNEAIENAIRFAHDDATRLQYRSAKANINFDYMRSADLAREQFKLRPTDDAFGNVVFQQIYLGRRDEIVDDIRDRFANYELSADLAGTMALGLRTTAHAPLMREIARGAIQRFGHDSSTMYQVHRMLLWAGDVDGASGLVPQLLQSDLDPSYNLLVQLRQACMERRLSDARDLHEKLQRDHEDEESIMWLAHKIIGDQASADAIVDVYDQQEDYTAISGFLAYPHFDVTKYPNFMRRVDGQGLDNREVLDLPYRCNR